MPALPVDSDRLGAVAAGHVEPVMPWIEGPDGKRRPGTVQETDEATGLPLWTVHVMIAGGDRPELAQVRVPSRDCPSPTPLAPIGFERLAVNVRLNRSGAIVSYWSAAGLADHRRQGQHKPQEQAA
jgi:hypothetical protein